MKTINQIEQEADALALEILMPEQCVCMFLEKIKSNCKKTYLEKSQIKLIAKHFSVSETACTVRLRDLNYLARYA